MERNIRHVQRWLERCLEAYRHRRRGVALAELESARAELEIAREMLAEELAGRERSTGLSLSRFSRVALTSCIFLFGLALPTAHRADLVASHHVPGSGLPNLSFEMVTEEERLLLQNLRRPPTVARVIPTEPLPEAPVAPQLTAKAEDDAVQIVPAEDPVTDVSEMVEKKVSEPKSVTSASDKLEHGVPAPSVEEVLSLLQAGQRALQNPGKVIPIQP